MKLPHLGSIGTKFKWNNKRTGRAHVKERLDKSLESVDWHLKFPKATFADLST